MILTGDQIHAEVEAGRITIDPFDPECLEPNAYGFHLGATLLVYDDRPLDPYGARNVRELTIPESGLVLEPQTLYLGQTRECMGSHHHAAHLHARFSISSCGLFIQVSAPLGHTGAIIPWTLELFAVQPIRIYPGLLVGKLCFWENHGEIAAYDGRYQGAQGVLQSLLSVTEP